ncbi:MAG: Flp family type IVb pilin [Pseudomonadota bacterium]|uniref:Pilus assembly protein Flp/PilA n=1 Tax=Thalassococcus halodurans TaxID=373675 RepID=A0A1H6BE88_9RHOB|nr:Flp family type IVb pilin [Thalassococcus halodurans]MEC8582448.1 Flp family type IVb pilin [Pseudomonadota bacterium]SEG59088.1 hypothetical protein SAMN04488045_3492 [Thalassococcus halodurans]
MKDMILKTMVAFQSDERGVTLVEYGIALALAVTLGVAALSTLGGEVSGAMGAAGLAMPN